jgi:5,10-methylenetetrahydromethanopterin reductase
MRKVTFGVVLQGIDPPEEFAAFVREVEALGFDSLWLTDSSLHARYVYSYLTLAALNTRRLRIGTSVTNPVTRHPALGTLAIATVDEVSGGRAVYGIGAGDRPIEALGYRPAKLAELRAAIDVTRRLLRGESVTYRDGAFSLEDAHFRFEARADLPIFVSASGPKTLELAGEVADGVILLGGLFPEGVEYALGHVKRGAERAGRRPPEVAAFLYGSVREDAALAIEEARPIAAWFCQTAPVYCEMAGVPRGVIEAVQRAYRGGEFQEAKEAAGLVPDAMVQKLALAGTEEDARRKVEMLLDLGITSINLFPLGSARREVVRTFARRVMPACIEGGER